VELPYAWKGLTMDRYDGRTIPDEHVDVFATQVELYTTGDAFFLLCIPNFSKRTNSDLVYSTPISFDKLLRNIGYTFRNIH